MKLVDTLQKVCSLAEVQRHFLRVIVRAKVLQGDQLLGSGTAALFVNPLVVVVEELC